MILAFPFDNTEYGAEALGAWLATRTRGVFSAEENLRVVANNNRTVTVKKGIAWLKMRDDWGIVFNNTEDMVFTVSVSDPQNIRVAAVVCQLDKISSKAEIILRIGGVGETPTPVRDDQYDEIILAHIFLRPGYTSITAENISDLRIDENYCGIMRDGVTQIPTSDLQEQASALLETIRQELEQLHSGTGVMLKSVYDPADSGIVSKAATAEKVSWSGITDMPTERFLAHMGVVGRNSRDTFCLSGLTLAYKMLDYWVFDFSGTRFYKKGNYSATSDFGFSIENLEMAFGTEFIVPDDGIVGCYSIFNGTGATDASENEATGKMANGIADVGFGGVLVAKDSGYLMPATITDEDGGYEMRKLNESVFCSSRNDQWMARFYLQEK